MDTNEKTHVLLHLSLIDGIGSATVGAIISHMHLLRTWSDIYQITVSEWVQQFGISSQRAVTLCDGLKNGELLQRELALLERHRISLVTVLDDSYPVLLKEIPNPPVLLYYRGILSQDNILTNTPVNVQTSFQDNLQINSQDKSNYPILSIVGSRQADSYAQRFIESIVPPLVALDWTIISGGALGVDSMAHRATLNAQGHTVVVLGSGLLCPYPRENIRLFEEVVSSGGALISSFSALCRPSPVNFPARNRIIAGMSGGCLVVQAARKSGASITAHYALEYGREVFAVPGSIESELSIGCHALLREGATLVEGIEDILEGYGVTATHAQPFHKFEAGFSQLDLLKPDLLKSGALKKDSLKTDSLNPGFLKTQAQKDYTDRTAEEQGILKICFKPSSVDRLLIETGLLRSTVCEILCDLQIEGLMDQNESGFWVSL